MLWLYLFLLVEAFNYLILSVLQFWFETDKAAYLLRQYFFNNLHDRLSTRPFLSLVEKKWLAFQVSLPRGNLSLKDHIFKWCSWNYAFKFLVVVQLLFAVKQSHENGVCHGELAYLSISSIAIVHAILGIVRKFREILQVILSVRMCSSLPGIGFTLLTLLPSNRLIFPMMIPLISPFSSTLEEEGDVILLRRLVLFLNIL